MEKQLVSQSPGHHDHSHHSHDHNHNHSCPKKNPHGKCQGSSAECCKSSSTCCHRKECPPGDDCDCHRDCSGKGATLNPLLVQNDDHNHDHKHNHAQNNRVKPSFIDEEDDDCECCNHDHIETSHDHDHNHLVRQKPSFANDSDSCDCCHVETQLNPHDHDHGHNHSNKLKPSFLDEDDDCECCNHDQPNLSHDHGHEHGHEHGHDHQKKKHLSFDDHEDCCGCEHDHADASHGSFDHGHTHYHKGTYSTLGTYINEDPMHEPLLLRRSIERPSDEFQKISMVNMNPMVKYNVGDLDVESGMSLTAPLICSSCDPNSPIEHILQVTRFRVANLCCAGEEKLIRQALETMTGVEHIAINIVGRYAIVKHCPIACCAPGDVIMAKLNDLHLGVSIQDAGDEDDNDVTGENLNPFHVAHVFLVIAIFIVGFGMYLSKPLHSESSIVFLIDITFGILPILKSACISLFLRKTIDIHLLLIVAVSGAIAGKEYFDASLVISLFLTAEFTEAYVLLQVQRAVKLSSASAVPKNAYLADGRSVPVETVKIGDILAVRAGEMIVCDGIVSKGDAVVDESSLTGEAIPISKKKGSKVLSGTVVQNGYLEYQVTTAAQDSTIKRIRQAVEDVQADRGEFANLIDLFSQYWTPFVILSALSVVVIGGGVTSDWWKYVNRGLILLILACPCAIVIAAPIPSICTIASAAKLGVLIRGSSIIEKMCLINTVAVDKTGTVTKGFFKVTHKKLISSDVAQCSDLENTARVDEVMRMVVALEQKSTHPLANALISDVCGCIAEMMNESKFIFSEVKKVKVLDGIGLEGWIHSDDDWKHIAVGNERLLSNYGGAARVSKSQQAMIDDFNKHSIGQVVLFVTLDDELQLILSLADEVRPESVRFVDQLHGMNIDVCMLTGDAEHVALQVCQELSIPSEDCFARLLPEDKLRWVMAAQEYPDTKEADLLKKKKEVLMIGDGINDSTALAASRVGVAMGAGGTAMAVAAADVILLNDNLLLLPSAIRLCRASRRTIIENCAFAVAVKIIAIILAILGLMEFWQAVLIDIGSLLVVVCNGTKSLWAPFLYNVLFPNKSSKKTN